MTKFENPYEGIEFYPAVGKYAATIPSHRNPLTLGYFKTIEEAIAARTGALAYEARTSSHA